MIVNRIAAETTENDAQHVIDSWKITAHQEYIQDVVYARRFYNVFIRMVGRLLASYSQLWLVIFFLLVCASSFHRFFIRVASHFVCAVRYGAAFSWDFSSSFVN